MSDSVWPHRRQPTRPLRPWHSPGKNTGVGCYFLLQCMKVKSESEVAQSDPMDCSTSGLPVHPRLPGFTQTHVHWVGDAIQPSHPLSSPSPPAFNLSQHQGLSTESALRIRWAKYWNFSFSISPSNEYSGLFPLRLTGLISLVSKGLSGVFPNTTVQKHQHHSSKPSQFSF